MSLSCLVVVLVKANMTTTAANTCNFCIKAAPHTFSKYRSKIDVVVL